MTLHGCEYNFVSVALYGKDISTICFNGIAWMSVQFCFNDNTSLLLQLFFGDIARLVLHLFQHCASTSDTYPQRNNSVE